MKSLMSWTFSALGYALALALLAAAVVGPFWATRTHVTGEAGLYAWLPWVAAALVFPVIPLVWQLLAGRGSQASAGSPLQAGDRFKLRTLAVAGASVLAVMLAAPQSLAQPLRQVGHGAMPYLPSALQAQVADWLRPAARPLVEYAPEGSEWLVVADLERLDGLRRPGQETRSPLATESCGVDLRSARAMFALKFESEKFMLALQADGLGELDKLRCLVGQLGKNHDTQAEVRLSEEGDWRELVLMVGEQDARAFKTRVRSVDADTLIFVSDRWLAASERALLDQANVLDGPLGEVIESVDQASSFWGALRTDSREGRVQMAGDADVVDGVLHWQASMDTGKEQEAHELVERVQSSARSLKALAASASILGEGEKKHWMLDIQARKEGSAAKIDVKIGTEVIAKLATVGLLHALGAG